MKVKKKKDVYRRQMIEIHKSKTTGANSIVLVNHLTFFSYTWRLTLHSIPFINICHTFGMDLAVCQVSFFFSFCVKNLLHEGLSLFYLHLTWNLATETCVTLDVKLEPDCMSSQKRLNSYKTPSFFIGDTNCVCGGIIGCSDSLQMLFPFNSQSNFRCCFPVTFIGWERKFRV